MIANLTKNINFGVYVLGLITYRTSINENK
ncbi:hypothetical protein SAMN04515674_111127 [Pseudarcicella hirudinis]|uniref:Uncharacterized protein n=1 Tax=Pseudarcicella hirudinis TaxID=1079859 RepID=A0A1I5WE95_9BACT|nr:hypothetical protein SAMN04515674_111127 [Pseudarcicella hirudinis]